MAALTLIAVFAAPHLPANAETWSLSGDQEHPPAAPRNRIIKWCEEDGAKVRYASANIKLKGYTPCGNLGTKMTCDASGTRLIGDASERPRGHLDCAVGPRIEIFNYSDSDTVDRTHAAKSLDDIAPMSEEEQQQMARELSETISKNKQQSPAVLAKALEQFVQQALSQYPNRDRQRGNFNNSRMLEGIIKHLDPSTKQALEQILNPKP